MEKAQNENRIVWVDIAKGYGIILVILGHIGFGRFGDWIYSFHLPLFVFLSGYVFKKNSNWQSFLAKLTKTLIIPYVCFTFVLFLCEFFPFDMLNINDIGSFFVCAIIQKRFRFIWYLAYLFLIELLFYTISRMTENRILLLLICTGLTVIGHVYNILYGIPLIWNVDAAFFSMLFFCLGYCYRTCWETWARQFTKGKIVIAAISLVISLITVFVAGNRLELFAAEFGKPGLVYISALFGIIFVIALSKSINSNAIAFIGRNSLSYYLTHLCISFPISVQIVKTFGLGTGEFTNPAFVIMYKFVLLILALMVSTVVDYLYRLIKNRVIFFINQKKAVQLNK